MLDGIGFAIFAQETAELNGALREKKAPRRIKEERFETKEKAPTLC